MSFNVGKIGTNSVKVIHLNGLEHVDITDADVRTGKISINSNGEKVIGNSTQRYLEKGTSDATALAEDINNGKTLWVNGQLITGIYTDLTVDKAVRGNNIQYIANENIIAGEFVKEVKTISGNNSIGISTPNIFVENSISDVITVPLSNNRILIGYRDNGNSGYGTVQILAVNGSEIITGEKYIFNNASTMFIALTVLEDNKVLLVYSDEPSGRMGTSCILNIDNNVINISDKYIFNTGNTTDISVTTLLSNKALVVYRNNSGYGESKILTVNGNNIVGSDRFLFNSYGTSNLNVITLNATRALVFYSDSGYEGYGRCRLLHITDNVITGGRDFTFYSGNTNSMKAIKLDSTRVLIAFVTVDSGNCSGKVLTVTDTSITGGSTKSILSFNNRHLSMSKINENKVIITCRGQTSSSYNGSSIVLNINGTTITPANVFLFSTTSVDNVSSSMIDMNKLVVAYTNTNNNSVGTTMLIQPDYSTDKISNNISDHIYSYTVSKLKSPDDTIKGIATTDGNSGQSINVKIPF